MNRHTSLARLAVLVSLWGSIAAGRVDLTLYVPPPSQMKFENLWRVDIYNHDTATYRAVYLHGSVVESRKGEVFRTNTTSFDLPPGHLVKRSRDVSMVDYWYAEGYEVYVLRTGTVPEGDYTYIVELKGLPNDVSDTVFFQVRQPDPPRLLTPGDGDTLISKLPLFTWMPPMPQPGGTVNYRITICELLPGQTKEDAMVANLPWFEQDELRSSSLRYPVAARTFEDDREYAWQVQAFVETEPIGVSETRTFRPSISGNARARNYAWAVDTVRVLRYRLRIDAETDSTPLSLMQAEVKLEFEGEGAVKLSLPKIDSGRTSRPPSSEYTMLPTGALEGDELFGQLLAGYCFDVLPLRPCLPGDTWTRLHGLPEPEGSDTLEGGNPVVLSAQFRLDRKAQRFAEITANYQLTGRPGAEVLFSLTEGSGLIRFDCVERCVQSASLSGPSVKSDPDAEPEKMNIRLERIVEPEP
jgi:hypothetical protein